MTSSHSQRHQYVLGCGSNLGDRLAHLSAAARMLASHGTVLARAPLYETLPIGAADCRFLNSAVLLASALEPRPLLAALLDIEAQLGRVRTVRWGNRTVDLDILLWRRAAEADTSWIDATCAEPDLSIPHPALLSRDFALVPAAQIAPDWRHPATGLSLAEEVRQRRYELTPREDVAWG